MEYMHADKLRFSVSLSIVTYITMYIYMYITNEMTAI